MYATLESLKAYLRLDETDELDDDELTRALQVASAEIDHLCSRSFPVAGGAQEARLFIPTWNRTLGSWVVGVDDTFDDTTTVHVWDAADSDYTTELDASTVFYGPNSTGPWTELALTEGFSGSSLPGWGWSAGPEAFVRVTSQWGYPAVPPSVEQACLIQAARIHRRRDAIFGIVNSLDGSSQARLRGAVDTDVAVMLRGYIKYWGAR